jgi:hypothetical protein
MFSAQEVQPGALSTAALDQKGLEGTELFASILSRPVEVFLRLESGSLHYSLAVIAASTGMMLVVPALITAVFTVISLIPFTHFSPSVGLFSLWNFSEAFFVMSVYHAFRIWRRVTRMHTEDFSGFEGPPLFFFAYCPWARSHWTTRIVLEPLFVVLVAIVGRDLRLFQTDLAIFLYVSALALFMKAVAVYFKAYCYIRRFMDARNAAPILAALAKGDASEAQLAKLNLSAFPKDAPPEIRALAARSIARAYDPNAAETR